MKCNTPIIPLRHIAKTLPFFAFPSSLLRATQTPASSRIMALFSTNDSSRAAVRAVFVYGSLRPDDDSGRPWTVEAVSGTTSRRAVLRDHVLFRDGYACAKNGSCPGLDERLRRRDRAAGATASGGGGLATRRVVGCVLTVDDDDDDRFWYEKLRVFDRIEGYHEDNHPDDNLYTRTVATAEIAANRESISSSGDHEVVAVGTIRAPETIECYVYVKNDANEDYEVPEGDWLKRDRTKE